MKGTEIFVRFKLTSLNGIQVEIAFNFVARSRYKQSAQVAYGTRLIRIAKLINGVLKGWIFAS